MFVDYNISLEWLLENNISKDTFLNLRGVIIEFSVLSAKNAILVTDNDRGHDREVEQARGR